MSDIVVFAAGSTFVVDVEESARRSGFRVRAAIRNIDGPCHTSPEVEIVEATEASPQLKQLPFVVPLFTPGYRQRAYEEATLLGFGNPLTLVDASAVLPQNIELGTGVYINAACVIGGAGALGDFVLINRGASIGHHVQLGRFVSIGPGAVLAGHVTIEDGATVGAGATILPKISIGKNAVIGAGAVVTSAVGDGELVVGNPARVIRSGIAGLSGVGVE